METITANNYVSNNIWSLSPEATVFEAYEKMKKEQIHHVPIIENGIAMGMVSDRDLQFVTNTSDSREIKCRDIMTSKPVSVLRATPLTDVARLMLKENVNSVVINSDEGKVVGIFTSTDAIEILTRK